jgi:bifunctional UDP-N-acetylglucosamine pyrophosphorylase/glucosamine-1-phosphate N-acetyltransferase
VKTVVLAAGKGIRLHPITLTRPKHLIPIGGKPLLEHLLLSLKTAGLDEALIIVNYLAEQIEHYFGDGSKIGMKLDYAFQPEISGTADATNLAEFYVKDDFLLIYGDLLITSDAIKQILRSHEKNRTFASMSLVPVKHPEHYGIVETTESLVTSIIEKPHPDETPTHLANAGIFIFSPDIFEKIKRTKSSLRGEYEITDTLRLLIEDKKSISAVHIKPEEWFDVGRPWNLLEANHRVLIKQKPEIKATIEEGVHLSGSINVAEGTRLRSGTYIEGPVFIGEGCDIGPNCYIRSHTSIGKDARIGNGCEIKNSIIMNNVSIGHLSYVGDSVIGENSNLGAGSIIANFRFDGNSIKMMIKGEVVDSNKEKLGTIMGDDVRTGINASIMPGVKIGPRSWIGPNIVVYKDVSPESFLFLKQKIEKKDLKGGQNSQTKAI